MGSKIPQIVQAFIRNIFDLEDEMRKLESRKKKVAARLKQSFYALYDAGSKFSKAVKDEQQNDKTVFDNSDSTACANGIVVKNAEAQRKVEVANATAIRTRESMCRSM